MISGPYNSLLRGQVVNKDIFLISQMIKGCKEKFFSIFSKYILVYIYKIYILVSIFIIWLINMIPRILIFATIDIFLHNTTTCVKMFLVLYNIIRSNLRAHLLKKSSNHCWWKVYWMLTLKCTNSFFRSLFLLPTHRRGAHRIFF